MNTQKFVWNLVTIVMFLVTVWCVFIHGGIALYNHEEQLKQSISQLFGGY